jgi:hypothetical protein
MVRWLVHKLNQPADLDPLHEKYGNYVDTVLPLRYDASIHIDETRALHSLHMPVSPDEELPEMFPSGL